MNNNEDERNTIASLIIKQVNARLRARRGVIPNINNNSTIQDRIQHASNHLWALQAARNEINRLPRSILGAYPGINQHNRIKGTRELLNRNIQRQTQKKQLLQRAVEYQQDIDRKINKNMKLKAQNIY